MPPPFLTWGSVRNNKYPAARCQEAARIDLNKGSIACGLAREAASGSPNWLSLRIPLGRPPRRELQRRRIDAVAQTRRARPVGKDVTQMGVTAATDHFRPPFG